MDFTITSEVVDKVAKLKLTGELDSLSARVFQKEIEKVALESPTELVLDLENLSFMSSAGLRVLIFSKQKMGVGLTIYIVKPQEIIVDTLEKTGLQHSVNIVDQYPV
ncbi:anti-anti-sigma factor (plasmid) [Runella rosea]|jgi:anti-anti-sigma factor|uniref:Anti-sigma factor antagonist n=2 Tax=Runella TaxID=105 RepID=A0A344TTB4_9BACT|nr:MULTISPECIES: anti-sigma factor antagonist [Runella]AXE21885.1 anti-anti-sigma factor [Runella rosea]NBB21938.1 anti-sigma factor antagonist [Runella sp. CRIBMP]RDB02746.1 STAS domain-containing protein [Runella aurantiaca]